MRLEAITGVLQSAGFLFFAFAGYARLATLGEEGTGSLTEYKGTYSQYQAARARDDARSAERLVGRNERDFVRSRRIRR